MEPSSIGSVGIMLLKYLRTVGSTSQRELMNAVDLPVRKIRYAIRRLKEENLIISKPDLRDMRTLKYKINEEQNSIIEQIIKKENRPVST